MKISSCIISLLLLTQALYAQDTNSRRQSNPPKDTTKKAGSGFLDAFAKGLQKEKQRRDSLNNYFRQHPMETNTYVSNYLIDRRVLPNEDAISLIKALNPRIKNLKEINYYAELKMPVFKRLKKTDRKRLRKECARLDKYNAAASQAFMTKLNELDVVTAQFNNAKIRSDARSMFSIMIHEIQGELALVRTKRMPMGITVFLTDQLVTLNQVVAEVNRSGTINQLQQKIVQGIKENLNYPSLKRISSHDLYKKQSRQRSFMVASSSFDETNENTDLFSSPADYSSNWIGEADVASKICAIYAKTVKTNGSTAKEVDIDVRYFFSYETAIQAQYKCKTGKCDGFLEQSGLVSANGANIIPSNYVFRFRDRESNKVYFRCISKELFERIQANPGNGNNRKFRIIFFPDNEECTAFMPR